MLGGMMALKKRVPVALLLLASSVLAQTNGSKMSIDLTNEDAGNNPLPKQVAIARCAYRQSEEGCPYLSLASDQEANNTLAQVPRRTPPMAGRQGPAYGPPMRGPAYPETWGPQFSPGHALIGAAIGFGLGATAGSKNGVRSSIAAGTLVGLIGAAIGAGIPSFPSHYRRRGWDDDEEASRRKPKPTEPGSPQSETATQVAASRQEPAETYQKNDFSTR